MALTVPPSDFWSGIDGFWSTFVLQVGTPPVALNVLISTSEPVEYVVAPQGCSSTKNTSCSNARGGLYDPNNSTSWQMKGWYDVSLETNLGYSGNKGEYGFDTVALGYQGSGGPSLGNQIVTAIATNDFYLGLFGLLPKSFNFQNYNDPYPSYLQTLKTAKEIPSISWAYTAGAHYRSNGVFASLTLGGYDVSRFEQNSISIPMNSDLNKYLSLGVQQVNLAPSSSSDVVNALSSGITMMLDSSLPYIWLPRDACDKISDAFNLDYDDDAQLYTISDSSRQALLATSPPPSISFVLGASSSGGDTVKITLPYPAFDHIAQPPIPGVNKSTNYFPIKRAANDSQYVLGRAFFQEAYVIADFERNNFSVSQATFQTGARASLTAIEPPSSPTPMPAPKGSSNHAGAIAGAVVGVLVILAIIALAAFCILRRRRRRRQAHIAAWTSTKPEGGEGTMSSEDRDHVPPYSPPVDDMAELPANYSNRQELEARESQPGTPKHGYYARAPERAKEQNPNERSRSPLSELDARQVHELAGSDNEGEPEPTQTAKPLHLRTVSRDEIRSPSVLSGANGEGHLTAPERPISPADDLPGRFVQSPSRRFGSRERLSHSRDVSPPGSATLARGTDGDVSPVGSRTMSPALESKRSVSSDSVPIFLDKQE